MEYRDVPGFNGYRAYEDGSIWSTNSRWGRGEWRELGGGIDKDGYRKLILCNEAGRRYVRVNVLMLELFVGPPPTGMENPTAAHENGIRTDNRLGNLKWKTQKDNIADKVRHGTAQIGEKNGNATIRDDDVREIRKRVSSGEPPGAVAKAKGISPSAVSSITHRRTWKHVQDAPACVTIDQPMLFGTK